MYVMYMGGRHSTSGIQHKNSCCYLFRCRLLDTFFKTWLPIGFQYKCHNVAVPKLWVMGRFLVGWEKPVVQTSASLGTLWALSQRYHDVTRPRNGWWQPCWDSQKVHTHTQARQKMSPLTTGLVITQCNEAQSRASSDRLFPSWEEACQTIFLKLL